MDERILVSSEQYNLKKAFRNVIIVALVLSIVLFVWMAFNQYRYSANWYEEHSYYSEGEFKEYLEHKNEGGCPLSKSLCIDCIDVESAISFNEKYPTKAAYVIHAMKGDAIKNFCASMLPTIAIGLIMGLICLWLRSYEMTVTDKRVYGKVKWGKRVDLPVDAISAAATIPLLKGVSVSTSSGKIKFYAIKNATEIYKLISNLLVERQQEKAKNTVVASVPQSDETDQLRKYKDLLDSGVITQEEFDAKKKQLLGL